MKAGDIVLVVGDKSMPNSFIGTYGKVIDIYGTKLLIEFIASTEDKGSLSHTAIEEDLELIAVPTERLGDSL